MVELLATQGVILASFSEDGDFPIAAILLLSGFIFYAYVFFRYRNTDKRHRHETETEAEILNVEVADQRTGTLRGVSHSRMRGANNRAIRGAQHSFGNAGITEERLKNLGNRIIRP